MFEGYLELGGVPLINTDATEQYLKHLLPGSGLRSTIDSDTIHTAIGHDPYRTPLLDDAAWANPNEPASHGFLGLYPIAIEGLDDDTMVAPTVEYLTDGGSVGAQRRAAKPIRVSGLLVGTDDLAVQYGRDWLGTALRTGQSGVLRYFMAKPDVCEDGVFGPVNDTGTRAFGALAAGVYRYRFPDETPESMPARAHWEGQFTEGAAIRVGAAYPSGVDEYASSTIFQPLRRNYAKNPTFRTGLTDWSRTGQGSFTWVADSDKRGYVQVRSGTTSTGQFGYDPFGETPFGGVPAGTSVGPAVRNLTLPIAAGPAAVAIALRSLNGSTATITVSQGGTVLGTSTVVPTMAWQRYGLAVTVPASDSVVVSVSLPADETSGVDVDDLTVEIGSYFGGAYFDGSSLTPGYTVSWEGPTDASVARSIKNDFEYIVRDDSRFRPFLEILSGAGSNIQLVWEIRPIRGIEEQLLPYERHLFDTRATSGVKVLRTIRSGSGGTYLQIEFELVAGNPAPYGLPEAIPTTPLANAIYSDPDIPITLQDISWLADPNLYAISLPPKAPTILNPSIEVINSWRRYYVPIPATAIADAAESVPNVAIISKDAPITQVRVRFHPNPFNWAPMQVDADSYCSEFVLSYLPATTRMEIDGVQERAFASRGDQSETAADHLLYGADGGPISWARLSCAIPYLMTVDVPVSSTIDAFDLELDLRRRF